MLRCLRPASRHLPSNCASRSQRGQQRSRKSGTPLPYASLDVRRWPVSCRGYPIDAGSLASDRRQARPQGPDEGRWREGRADSQTPRRSTKSGSYPASERNGGVIAPLSLFLSPLRLGPFAGFMRLVGHSEGAFERRLSTGNRLRFGVELFVIESRHHASHH